AFVKTASERLSGRKVDGARWLADFYETACQSVGVPVAPESETVRMLRVVLDEYRALCALRKGRCDGPVRSRRVRVHPSIQVSPVSGGGIALELATSSAIVVVPHVLAVKRCSE